MFSLFVSLTGITLYAYFDIFDKYQTPEVRIGLAVAIVISVVHLSLSLITYIAKYTSLERKTSTLLNEVQENAKELVKQNQRLIEQNKDLVNTLEKVTLEEIKKLRKSS